MAEIFKPAETVHWIARNADGSVLHQGTTSPDQVTTTGQPVLDESDSGNEQLQKLSAFADKFPPMPPEGTQVNLDEIYSLTGVLYRVRQSHIRTSHAPDTIPALWLWYRADATINWVAGEQVYVGTIRTSATIKYKCIQAHVTQAGWEPVNVPALWELHVPPQPTIPDWVQPTGAHDAYAIGDKVKYQSNTWQSTVAANVWAPGVYGWIEIQ